MVACAGASIGVSDTIAFSLDWPLSLGDAVGRSPGSGSPVGVSPSLGAVGLGCVGLGCVGLGCVGLGFVALGSVGPGCVGFGVLGSEVDGSEDVGVVVVGAGSAGAVPEGAVSDGDGFAGGVTVGVGPNEAAGELELRSERSDARSAEPSTVTTESVPTALVEATATTACAASTA